MHVATTYTFNGYSKQNLFLNGYIHYIIRTIIYKYTFEILMFIKQLVE